MNEILSTKNLIVGYSSPIVEGVNISTESGEITVIVGPNGAGKTTLLKTVCGIIPPLSGDVLLVGSSLKKIPLGERAKLVAAVLTEKTFADYSCEEMVAMGRYPYTNGIGSLSEDDKNIVSEAMELTNVLDISDRSFLKISDGQRQRVLLARAICQRPKLLVLDEPTSFLDVKYKMDFLRLLKKLSTQMGFSVLMSLHELDMAKQIADKMICIKENRVDRIGAPGEIFTGGYINELFDIKNGTVDESSGLGIIWDENIRK